MRARGLVAVMGALLGALLGAGRAAVPPGPAPSLRQEPSSAAAARRNDACLHCHRAEAEDWHASAHARAATNPAFVAALEREPEARHGFCLDCHAPERRTAGRDAEAEALGVACVTCHAPLGAVLAGPDGEGGPHGVVRAGWFAGVEACAGCHQFDYPGEDWPLQNTVHESVELSDQACQDCHMPRHGGHRFPGAYDARFVARAVEVEAVREGGTVRLSLTPRPPHAVPTGDLYRRLRLTVTGADGGARHRYFGRRFERRHEQGVERMRPLRDDRLHLGTSVVAFEVPPGPVRWELVLERVAYAPTSDPADDVVEGATAMAEGEL